MRQKIQTVPDGKQLKCLDVVGESYNSVIASNSLGSYVAYTSGRNTLKIIDTKNYTVVSEFSYNTTYGVQTLSFDDADNISLGEKGTVDMWSHIRLIGIAVMSDIQQKGLGRRIMLYEMKKARFYSMMRHLLSKMELLQKNWILSFILLFTRKETAF